MMWGPIFNCKWPAKVLQDLFKPPFVPDPEFKPFDLQALGAERSSGSSRLTNSRDAYDEKREPSFQTGKIVISELAAPPLQQPFLRPAHRSRRPLEPAVSFGATGHAATALGGVPALQGFRFHSLYGRRNRFQTRTNTIRSTDFSQLFHSPVLPGSPMLAFSEPATLIPSDSL